MKFQKIDQEKSKNKFEISKKINSLNWHAGLKNENNNYQN